MRKTTLIPMFPGRVQVKERTKRKVTTNAFGPEPRIQEKARALAEEIERTILQIIQENPTFFTTQELRLVVLDETQDVHDAIRRNDIHDTKRQSKDLICKVAAALILSDDSLEVKRLLS